MARHVSSAKIAELQRNTANVRNMCILAHVDHGKTTLADALVASNGIISQRLAGKLRYMDSRRDEQERGITMKSSAVALHHVLASKEKKKTADGEEETEKEEEEFLVNLIDSPGHVDFSSEVSTALRLCDGAVVVVDVVEGVCPQTVATLRQAWHEGVRPVLVLNKLDRLVLETKLSPVDAYVRLVQLLEQVNAVMGGFFATEVFGKDEQEHGQDQGRKKKPKDGPHGAAADGGGVVFDWSSPLDDADDSDLYFTPDSGNVLFASAVDGWGFGISGFAAILSAKLGIRADVLRKTLWGDYYLDSRTKRVVRGARAGAKKPLFVQLVLDNVFAVYEAVVVRKDAEKRDKIIGALGLKVSAKDLRTTDHRVQLVAIMSQWLPLASAVLGKS